MRIAKIRVRHGSAFDSSRRDESPQPIRVIPRAEVIEAGFGIAFFAGEFVVVGVVGDELQLAAPGVIIRVGHDHASGIGNDRSGLQMVREVIEHAARAVDPVAAGHALAVKEDIFAFDGPAEIGFGHHSGRHVPVERGAGGRGRRRRRNFFHPIAVAVINIAVAGSAGDAVFLIVGIGLGGRRRVEYHVAGGVILVVSARGVNPVMRVGGDTQMLSPALGLGFVGEAAPRVVAVAVAPVFVFVLEHLGGAVRPGVLRRGQAVQRVISECLAAIRVFIVGDAPNIAVVTAAFVKIVADRVNRLAGRNRRHGDRLKAVVVCERISHCR